MGADSVVALGVGGLFFLFQNQTDAMMIKDRRSTIPTPTIKAKVFLLSFFGFCFVRFFASAAAEEINKCKSQINRFLDIYI